MNKPELQAYFWPKIWQPLPPTERDWLDPPKPLMPTLPLCQASYIVDLVKYVEVNLIRLEGPPRLAALAEENLNIIYHKLNQLQ